MSSLEATYDLPEDENARASMLGSMGNVPNPLIGQDAGADVVDQNSNMFGNRQAVKGCRGRNRTKRGRKPMTRSPTPRDTFSPINKELQGQFKLVHTLEIPTKGCTCMPDRPTKVQVRDQSGAQITQVWSQFMNINSSFVSYDFANSVGATIHQLPEVRRGTRLVHPGGKKIPVEDYTRWNLIYSGHYKTINIFTTRSMDRSCDLAIGLNLQEAMNRVLSGPRTNSLHQETISTMPRPSAIAAVSLTPAAPATQPSVVDYATSSTAINRWTNPPQQYTNTGDISNFLTVQSPPQHNVQHGMIGISNPQSQYFSPPSPNLPNMHISTPQGIPRTPTVPTALPSSINSEYGFNNMPVQQTPHNFGTDLTPNYPCMNNTPQMFNPNVGNDNNNNNNNFLWHDPAYQLDYPED